MLNKPLFLVIAVLFSFNLLFGYLSYTFYGKLKQAEISLDKAVEANKSLESSLELKAKSCKIDETVSTEFQVENKAKEKEKEDVISELDKIEFKARTGVDLESTTLYKYANPKTKSEKVDEISLDSKLPAAVAGLLQRHCDSVKGSACDNP